MIAAYLLPFPVRGVSAPYLWFFYRLLTAYKEPMLFISSQEYRKSPKEWSADERWEVTADACNRLGYSLPSESTFSCHSYFDLSEKIFVDLLAECGGNPTAAFRRLLCDRIPSLEKELSSALRDVGGLEAILTLCNCPSLTSVAKEFGVPVVHIELGPLRAPLYHATAYFDFRGVNGNTEFKERYLNASWSADDKWDVDDLKALLQQRNESDNNVTRGDSIGVVLQVDDDSNLVAFGNGYSNQDLLNYAALNFDVKSLLVRTHPGSAFDARNVRYDVDRSCNTVEFFKRCKHVLTVNSSVGFEAMLHRVPVTVVGDCSYRFILDAGDSGEFLRRISFYLLAYLVPMDLVFEPWYLRFRLSFPDDRDIAIRHLKKYGELTSKLLVDGDIQLARLNRDIIKRDDQLAHVNQIIAERDTQLTELTETIAARDILLATLSQRVAEKDAQLFDLGQTVVERDSQLSCISQVVDEREARLAELGDTLARLEAQRSELSLAIGQRDSQLSHLSQVVADREARLADLGNSLAKLDAHYSGLAQAIGERESQLSSLSQVVAERDSRLVDLDRVIMERDSHIADLSRMLTERDRSFNQLINSRSWRLTKPVRFLGRLLGGDFKEALGPVLRILRLNKTEMPANLESQSLKGAAMLDCDSVDGHLGSLTSSAISTSDDLALVTRRVNSDDNSTSDN